MVEILMATYNGEKYLNEQIESILGQSYEKWHLTICDDCSTDNTAEIAREYEKTYPEKITFVQNMVNSGSAAKNFFDMLIRSKSNAYIMFSDQDDVWDTNKIKYTFDAMRQMELKYGRDVPLLIHSDLRVVDEKLNTLDESMFYTQKLQGNGRTFKNQLTQNCITGCTMMFNQALTSLIEPDSKNMIMHDWWIGILAAAFGHIGFISRPLINYRQHGNNAEGAKNFRGISETIERASKKNEIKHSLDKTYIQAEEFKKIYYSRLDNKKKKILDAYIEMRHLSKPLKIYNIIKYGFGKTGVNRMIGYILYV